MMRVKRNTQARFGRAGQGMHLFLLHVLGTRRRGTAFGFQGLRCAVIGVGENRSWRGKVSSWHLLPGSIVSSPGRNGIERHDRLPTTQTLFGKWLSGEFTTCSTEF